MINWVLSLLSAVLTSLLISVIKDNIRLRREKKEKEKADIKAEDELLLGLARVMLMQSLGKALDRGNTTTTEYEILNKLFTAYTEKGGNGAVKHLFDRYNTLKVF